MLNIGLSIVLIINDLRNLDKIIWVVGRKIALKLHPLIPVWTACIWHTFPHSGGYISLMRGAMDWLTSGWMVLMSIVVLGYQRLRHLGSF